MRRRRADVIVGVLVAVVLLVGGALSWQTYQQQRAFDQMGSMMGTSMGTVHGTNPLWYALGTLLVAAVVGGVYLTVRGDLTQAGERVQRPSESPSTADGSVDDALQAAVQSDGAVDPEAPPRARVLDLLPDDERRVLEPVLASPGITQIELRDRSEFSKSKVSQTVGELEKRGLLYRERQGRTYRIYPSDDLRRNEG